MEPCLDHNSSGMVPGWNLTRASEKWKTNPMEESLGTNLLWLKNFFKFCWILLFHLVVRRSQLETTLKTFNNYQEVHGGSGGVKSREVNGRLILEGVLKLYWGIHSSIQLKEDDDQRLPCSTSTLKSQRKTVSNGSEFHVLILKTI